MKERRDAEQDLEIAREFEMEEEVEEVRPFTVLSYHLDRWYGR